MATRQPQASVRLPPLPYYWTPVASTLLRPLARSGGVVVCEASHILRRCEAVIQTAAKPNPTAELPQPAIHRLPPSREAPARDGPTRPTTSARAFTRHLDELLEDTSEAGRKIRPQDGGRGATDRGCLEGAARAGTCGLAQQAQTHVAEQRQPTSLDSADGQEDFHCRPASHGRAGFPRLCYG